MDTTAIVVVDALIIGVACRFALLARQGGHFFPNKGSSTAQPRGER